MLENEIIKVAKSEAFLFWEAAGTVITDAEEYSRVVKLRNNLNDETTAFKVQPILDEYFNGSMNCLCERIAFWERQFYVGVEKFNVYCRMYRIHPVNDPRALLDLLLDPRRRKSYRGRIKTKEANCQICPLQYFEVARRRRN